MKNLIKIVAGGVAVVSVMAVLVGIKFNMFNTDVIVMSEEPKVIVEIETVDSLEVLIKEAQDEARESIEKQAQDSYNQIIEDEMKAVEDKVKTDYILELEKTITSEDY